MPEELSCHVIITGSRQAGISSFINQRAEDFEAHDEGGMGIDIQTTNIEWSGKNVHMIFYEIAGTFPLDSLHKIYRKKNAAFAIMFDLSNLVSMELAELLFSRVQDKLGSKMPSKRFLLGSHADLERVVTNQHVESLLDLMGEGTMYLEFSAKTGENLKETMEKMAMKIVED